MRSQVGMMTARLYCSLIAVLCCLSGYLSITDVTEGQTAAKPGECPPQTSGSLFNGSCNGDSDCPNDEKCCGNGSGNYCTAPYTVKPGQCPKPKRVPECADLCFHDGQCPATQKCCPTTCGHACSEQSDQESGPESDQESDQESGPESDQESGPETGQGSGQGERVE
ncbi:WAP four-disulfide core domain protein 5-like [Carassius carassius]|uniref:WAP four-disulfide core domain protein 5-like n=1 Tax=Carassius carassius TaxID=217509 RepID=UPI0028697956|nr:WAP four-disulfide core domain protein 5-like [Carassius carassius]